MTSSLPGVLTHPTLRAMEDFYRRAAQVQRTSRAKAPKYEMNQLHLTYSHAQDRAVAEDAIGRFVRVAEEYAETVLAHRPAAREWKKLQRPIAQLRRLKAEHVRWEALRRLKSPPLAKLKFMEFDAKMMKVNILPGSPPIVAHVPFNQVLDETFRDVEKDFLSWSKD